MLRGIVLAVIFVLLPGGAGFTQDAFSLGEELFMLNKPEEALPLLEAAALEDSPDVKAFMYLGIVYLQLNRLDDAIGVYHQILPEGGTETPRIAYNLGNAYYSKGDAVMAEQYYSQAINADPAYASAYLNRANTLVRSGMLKEAIPDYQQYLNLEPRSLKRPQIERLIAFINNEAVVEERRRVAAEAQARVATERARADAERAMVEAERQRIMAEAQAKADEERRRRLLEEVSASLQAAADYDGEFELE